MDTFDPDAWWLYQSLAQGPRAERLELTRAETTRALRAQAAHERVDELIEHGGAAAIAVILRLLDAATGPDGPETIGAGPLEDLVHTHGDTLIGALEDAARAHPSFMAALRCIWLSDGALTPRTVSRLARLGVPV